jgi:Protein kinase domain/AAA ATPase domain
MAGEPPLKRHDWELDTVAAPDQGRTLVAGRYELRRSLGRGASKEVFLATDARLGREVALARVRPARSGGSLPVRVLQEIRTTARLDEHPHIVTVHDVIDEDDATWIVSQVVRGGSVAELLAAHPDGIACDEAIRISFQVTDALDFAHQRGVIHRDVKPSNVLLAGPDNTALLTDFGVALVPGAHRVTVEGIPIGTAAYMSPEQARGETVDGRSDLYGLGAMLFELVCGRPPFTADTMAALIAQHLSEPPPVPDQLNPAIPADLSRLILQLLSKHPDDRPQSALAVRAALGALSASTVEDGLPATTPLEPLPVALAGDPARPFVDRVDAMNELRNAWRRAATERPQLAIVVGEAGIGKTHLASAFARVAYEGGGTVLYGRCDEDPLVSYQPFVEALRSLIAARPDLVDVLDSSWSAEAGELSRLIPELRQSGAASITAATNRETVERYQLFEAMLALLSPAAHGQPLLLVLDDMQWADKSTAFLLRHLVRSRVRSVMVLTTRRPPNPNEYDPLAKVTEDLEREIGARSRLLRVSLAGLDAEWTYELASAHSNLPVDHEFGRLLRAQTAGNPFFIDQVLRGLGEANLASAEDVTAALRSLEVPQEVQDFIAYRLAGFTADARELLEQAAVCGPEFRLDVLAELRGSTIEAVIGHLTEPITAGLVLEVAIGRFAFCHALVRETLYERRLSKSERARLHLRIGEALERMERPAQARELALHFHAAREIGGADRAVRYALAAAELAKNSLAYEEAAAYTREACEALECMGSEHDPERSRLLQSAGRLRWQAGDQAGAQEDFRQAAQLARQMGDATQFARAALGYAGRSYDAEAIDPHLRQLFTEALEMLPEAETSLRARLLARLAEALSSVDERRAIELTDEALDIVHGMPDNEASATVVAARHMALLHIDHHDERLEVGQRWVTLTEAGHRDSIGQALVWRLYDLIERGGVDDMAAIPGVREPLAVLVDKLRQPLHRHFLTCFDAKWLLMLGRFADAEQTAREGYKYGRVAQGSHVGLLYGGQRFALRREQGRLRELFADVVAFFDPDNPPLPIWRAGLILARHEAGDPRRAEAELRDMIRDRAARVPRDMFWLGTMCLLAESAATVGDQAAAAVILPLLEPHARFNAQIGMASVLGPVEAFLGILTGLLEDRHTAGEHFEAALERSAILRARPIEARVQCEYGEFLAARGGSAAHDRARELLRWAQTTAHELGMTGIVERANRALEQLTAGNRPSHAVRRS